MPSDDLILNVRQITQYPEKAIVPASDAVLLQSGGIGGPYYYARADDLVATALAASSETFLALNAQIGTISNSLFNGGTINGSCFIGGAFTGTGFTGTSGAFGALTVGGVRAATIDDIAASQAYLLGFYQTSTVWSFNGRAGTIILYLEDILGAGGAPISSPQFLGQPTAVTPSPGDNSNNLATTAFVQAAILASPVGVATFNGRTGIVTLDAADITGAGGALLASPAFTGTPTAPTPPSLDNSTAIATTAWVVNEVSANLGQGFAPITSPNFSGIPTAPTAGPGTSTGQIATTSFVMHAITAATTGVSSFNTRTGAVVLVAADVTNAGGALLASPTFTGVPSGPTAVPGTSTTQFATTAFVQAVIASGLVSTFNGRSGAVTLLAADVTGAGGAPIASPAFTGAPTGPTATVGTNTQQLATTAFVAAAIAAAPIGVATFNGRAGTVTLLANDISGASGALLAGPAFTGVPTAPTAVAGTNTTQLATCAFVMAQLAVSGVSSFNTRTGAVVLQSADITGAGGALLAGPSFSGVPTAPTAAPATSTLQLATTAFVATAVASSVVTFNSRTGNVTLLGTDITGAGGALLASPSFTGTPLAPTASPGTNTQQLATTAYVLAAITAGAVQSFNSRTGAVTLIANDISGAGGALLASPAFTGSPTAPTPGASSNNTSIATTAFVVSALAGAGGVSSWNGRAGTVTMTLADVTGAGGAPLAGPAFTGTPSAPTASVGTSTTQLATTAFVMAQLAAGMVASFNGRSGAVTLSSTDIVNANGLQRTRPTCTVHTAGQSGGYAMPAGVAYVRVRLVGGGGGGAAVGAGGQGGASGLGAWSVNGGGGGSPFSGLAGGNGGAGGTAGVNGAGNGILRAPGAPGFIGVANWSSTSTQLQAAGGASMLGVFGCGGSGGLNNAVNGGGGGGGAGEFLEMYMSAADVNQNAYFTVGGGGAGGAAGTGSYAGAAGGGGLLIIEEFY